MQQEPDLVSNIIPFNTTDASELPYVILPEYNIKVLLDSGSTKSFIDPDIANKFFPNLIRHDPFVVSTVFQKSAHKFSACIPATKLFKLQKNKTLKFYLFKFHNVFRGLIGLDSLKSLQATIDFDKGYLITPHTKIKLLFQKTQTDLNLINVNA